MNTKISLEQYLEILRRFSGSEYGKMVRSQFADVAGDTELAMLVAPSEDEIEQFIKAVAVMTPAEREEAGSLTDEQVKKIAADAQVDPADFAIFINGYALQSKRVS